MPRPTRVIVSTQQEEDERTLRFWKAAWWTTKIFLTIGGLYFIYLAIVIDKHGIIGRIVSSLVVIYILIWLWWRQVRTIIPRPKYKKFRLVMIISSIMIGLVFYLLAYTPLFQSSTTSPSSENTIEVRDLAHETPTVSEQLEEMCEYAENRTTFKEVTYLFDEISNEQKGEGLVINGFIDQATGSSTLPCMASFKITNPNNFSLNGTISYNFVREGFGIATYPLTQDFLLLPNEVKELFGDGGRIGSKCYIDPKSISYSFIINGGKAIPKTINTPIVTTVTVSKPCAN